MKVDYSERFIRQPVHHRLPGAYPGPILIFANS